MVSDSYTVPAENPWHDTTTVVSRADIAQWVTAERNRGRGDILTFGSRTTWNGLLTKGLIDELHLMISPTAVTDGTPLFESPTDLDLLEPRRFDDSNNGLLRYTARR